MFGKLLLVALVAVTSTQTSSCSGYAPPATTGNVNQTATDNLLSTAQEHQAKLAATKYDQVEAQMTENAEQDVIADYLIESTKPGFTSYVTLVQLGQVMGYFVAKGPVVDCNRQLTPNIHPAAAAVPVANSYYSSGSGSYEHNIYTADSPNDEGTYGGNARCVVFFTESGAMIRWTGDYLQSDRPVRVHQASLVTEVDTSAHAHLVNYKH